MVIIVKQIGGNLSTESGQPCMTGGQAIIAWQTTEDMINYIKDVIVPNAQKLGIEVVYKQTGEVLIPETQRPT